MDFRFSILDFGLLAQASPVPEIRDIAPPVEVFPYPLWMVVTAAAVALLVVGALVWLLVRWLTRRPGPPPPTPREVALRQLTEARGEMETTDPHAFSIRVSDILRRYITVQYGLRATRQTSPEFLASMAGEKDFPDEQKALLSVFLEKCDLLKFARIEAGADENATLLEQARRFVEGTPK